jgi:hypothetical protein
MNGLFEKVVLSYRLERFNRRILFHLHLFYFFHQFQALRDLIQTGWVFHVNGKQPFSVFRSVTLNGKRIIRMGFSIRNFRYKTASVQNRFWRVRFTIVAFICSLLQYFRAVVCFALQPFTISGEDK